MSKTPCTCGLRQRRTPRFWRFLIAQRERTDEVGDLVRIILADPRRRNVELGETETGLLMDRHSDRLTVFLQLCAEYRAYRKAHRRDGAR